MQQAMSLRCVLRLRKIFLPFSNLSLSLLVLSCSKKRRYPKALVVSSCMNVFCSTTKYSLQNIGVCKCMSACWCLCTGPLRFPFVDSRLLFFFFCRSSSSSPPLNFSPRYIRDIQNFHTFVSIDPFPISSKINKIPAMP